ncbi:MAG: putative endolysin [Prokaryotic dsDNA virus sp.]|nr:MAG: putative endolysin [Prokaryotic dsDNA virus sp.]|tara:strand:- start:675 stop:1130 length:456 start_codon:yes stop_codon:yes gene_type:complete
MKVPIYIQLRDELKADEGVKNEIYLDHLGLPTCGVGHLIRESDPEYGLDVGTHIDDERINELFDQDMETTLIECDHLYPNFDNLPDEAQKIIANMMFNLGRPRLSRFHKMKKAVDSSDWIEAANQMLDSKWARQVPNRANRLIERMKNIQT